MRVMRAMRVVLALLLAGCPPRHATNTLVEPRTSLASVNAPHIAIFVHANDGLSKVFLDTGQAELLTPARDAIVLDANTVLTFEDNQYVIQRGGERKVLSVEPPDRHPQVAPNGRLLAHAVSDTEIMTVDVETSETRRYMIPSQGPQRAYLAMTFTPTSDAIVFSQNGYFRIDLASGSITPADKIDYEIAGKRPEPTDCPLRGLRLEERSHKGKQEILMIPTATLADPERLSGTQHRVLVRATDKPQPHGDGAITMTWKHPGPLTAELFTPTCEHFVFALEDSIYVGNVATGKYARIAHGTSATLK